MTVFKHSLYEELADRFRDDPALLTADDLVDLVFLAQSNNNYLLKNRATDRLVELKVPGLVLEDRQRQLLHHLLDVTRQDPNYAGYLGIACRRIGITELEGVLIADKLYELTGSGA